MRYIFLLLWIYFSSSAYAQNSSTDTPQSLSNVEFLDSLNPQSGKITLPNAIATLNLPNTFEYLSPESTEKLLVNGWGNPPGNKTLGMVIPADVNPLGPDGWGVIISYDEDGHVSDADADDINYDDLLVKMKEDNKEANKERKKQGYDAMSLIGWAKPPHYNKATHKFYWAKEYASDQYDEHTLNYNIRVLGRKGVLVLNAVAGMSQLSHVEDEMPELLAVTDFTKGNRYQDFNKKTDHVAEYGLAALVAGGVAAKLGIFAKLFALLLAFKKVIIVGLVVAGGALSKFFKKKP